MDFLFTKCEVLNWSSAICISRHRIVNYAKFITFKRKFPVSSPVCRTRNNRCISFETDRKSRIRSDHPASSSRTINFSIEDRIARRTKSPLKPYQSTRPANTAIFLRTNLDKHDFATSQTNTRRRLKKKFNQCSRPFQLNFSHLMNKRKKDGRTRNVVLWF